MHVDITIQKLIWDEWNIEHIARHSVLPSEVEEICQVNSQTEYAQKGRMRITGLTKKGRLISTFLDPEEQNGVYYPVTARDASKKERISFQEWNKGGVKIK